MGPPRRSEAFWKHVREAEAPLVDALRRVGVNVKSVWDLVNTADKYGPAVPILLEHLQKAYHPRTREGIVRALTVREARSVGWEAILREYEAQPADEKSLPPEERGLKGALGNAVTFLATRETLPELLRLVRDRTHGQSRLFFVRRLARTGDQKTLSALEPLQGDADIGGTDELKRALKLLRKRVERNAP